MFKNKSEVDRHVQNCLKKVNNETERNLRCFSFAKLYFSVGDYEQAYRYISSYILSKPKSAEAHQLLGKSLEKLGKLDSALEAYKTSLQIDPKQNNVVIKVCEILSSDNIELDLSGARYFCELAQTFDPNNPAVYSLKERLITIDNENPIETSKLLLKELEIRPTDINLRIRLLKHFIQNNMIKEAYTHATMIEYKDFDNFHQSVGWYENFAEILLRFQKDIPFRSELTWEFWILLVSVMERLVALRLDDRNNLKGSTDYETALFNFDQMLYKASQNIDSCTDRQLISTFIMHYFNQLHFHISTLVLKQAKRDIIQFKEASHLILPALFIAYSSPPDIQSIWFMQSSEKTKKMVQRWYKVACFRCSQVGHILLANAKDNKSVLLEKAAQYSSGLWREQLYKKIFIKRDQHNKISSSFFVLNTPSLEPTLKLPILLDLLKYDEVAQLSHPDSLHHYVWIFLNSNISEINLIAFEGMQYSIKNLNNCSAESLNLLDIFAFIYCATLCAKSKFHDNKLTYYNLLPASITGNLVTTEQSIFMESVYKMYKNMESSNLANVRLTLIKGIETVRCVGHHGLEVRTLVNLANIFHERSSTLTKQSEIDFTISRAELYWKTALPLLEKIANNQRIAYVRNRLFDSGYNEITTSEANTFIDKGKLFIATQLMKKKCYDEALSMFEQLKDPYASFYQFEIYKQFAFDKMNEKGNENDTGETKNEICLILTKARDCLYLTLDRLREPVVDPSHPLNSQLGNEIDKIERMLSNIESGARREIFSDENYSFDISIGEEYSPNLTPRNKNIYTTKHSPLNQSTPLRLNTSRQEARPSPERLDAQIRQMMASRDAIFNLVSEQNKHIVEVQNNLIEKLNAVVNDLKFIKKDVGGLKESVNDIKNSVEDFQNVVDVVQEMKKEVLEFKKHDAKNQLSEEDFYVLDPDYGVDYNIPTNIGSYPPIVPGSFPNYQASKLPNPNHVTAYAPPMLYPGLYPGLPYTYGGLNLAQPGSLPFLPDQQQSASVTVSTATHLIPSQSSVSQNLGLDTLNIQALPTAVTQPIQQKELPKSTSLSANLKLSSGSSPLVSSFGKVPPVNVVITTSDPLPTENTLTSQPVLSVTIPPQHIKSNFSKPTTTPNKSDPTIKTNEKLILPIVDQDKHLNETSHSLNRSDSSNYSPEDHEPNVNFTPVIPLPDEVPVNTGEEGEIELFCGRAKLFRHVNTNGIKEWKERGVGNLKILKNPESGKTRILMRRDQVFKICANHFITEDMTLYPTGNSDKAFTWAAQDFSDGEIKSETLCVKFKLTEDANKFTEIFKSLTQSKKKLDIPFGIKPSEEKDNINKGLKSTLDSGKFLGGFTFTGTPTFLPKETETVATLPETKETNKNSPFSSFVFGKSDLSLTNLASTQSTISKDDNPDDGRLSPVEEFVPTAEFKPVVNLPELVDIKTGEENSEVLFEERTKLFRYDSSGEIKEWKERGIGTMKILKDKFIRLLMRRDQVHKICCNHRVLKDMIFKINSNNSKAVVWQAQDFSDEILKTEMFTARFKTEQIANNFLLTLQKAKDAMDENSAVVENISKQDLKITKFGGKSWECQTCKVKYDENVSICTSCTSSKSDLSKNVKEFSSATTNNIQGQKLSESGGFGDAFKIKPGSWECESCMIRNEEVVTKCVACNSQRKNATQESIQKQTSISNVSGFGDTFKLKPGYWECETCMVRNKADTSKCVACGKNKESGSQEKQTGIAKESEKREPNVLGFGDAFKLKPGSWECQICMVRNKEDAVKCLACGNSKNGALQEKETEKSKETPRQTFVFGIPTNTKFTLGGNDSFKNVIPPVQDSQWTFGIPKTEAYPIKSNEEAKSVLENNKPADKLSNQNSFSFISPTKQEFEFKQKLPKKSNDDSEDGIYVEEEEDNIYFKPVIPLPDKVEVKTGEEDDDILYCHKAKLFRYVDGEWKERGVGDIKILRNKCNGILRVVMRRIQVLKICLNHLLTKNVDYKFKDEKSLLFTAADFSEGTLVNQLFCVRFKNAEITQDFKKAVENALEGENINPKKDNEEIQVIFESKVTPEEEQEAIKLGLPPKFMSYKQLPDCTCDQCKLDDEYLKDLFTKERSTNLSTTIEKQNLTSTTSASTLPISFKDNNYLKDTSQSVNSNKTVHLKPSVLISPNKTPPKDIATSTTTTFSWPSSTTSNLFSFSNVSFNNTFSQTPKSENITPKQEIITTPKTLDDDTKLKQFTTPANTSIFGQNVTSIFATNASFNSPKLFGNNTSFNTSIFATNNASSNSPSIFGSNTSSNSQSIFGSNSNKNTNLGSVFDNKSNSGEIHGKTSFLFGQVPTTVVQLKETDDVVLKSDPNLSFASLAASSDGIKTPAFVKKDETFSFLGAGTPIFGSLKTTSETNKNESEDEHNASSTTEEYDPHFEPIIPLPDAITVTTGEENETILFNERAKLFRFDSDLKEWKERGVGQFKVLHHPEKNTYRLLLRREQIFKVVLNQLITSNFELQPMVTSDKAWIWAGYNYSDDESAFEKLAIKFKNQQLANQFYNVIKDVVGKLELASISQDIPTAVQNFNGDNNSLSAEVSDPDDNEPNDYEYDEDDENARSVMFIKECTLKELNSSGFWEQVGEGYVEVYYDPDLYAARIVVTDNNGCTLSKTLITTNTIMEVEANVCTWKSLDLEDDKVQWRHLKVIFSNDSAAQEFYTNYLEGVNYAEQIGLNDELSIEPEPEDK